MGAIRHVDVVSTSLRYYASALELRQPDVAHDWHEYMKE